MPMSVAVSQSRSNSWPVCTWARWVSLAALTRPRSAALSTIFRSCLATGSDTLRYGPAPVSGSANGNPKTNGFIGELDFNPWQNTRLGLQYTAYDKFNGAKADYDGFGRRASGNDTLYLLAWVVF